MIIVLAQANGLQSRNILETNERNSLTENILLETQNELRKTQEDLLLMKNEVELLKTQCATKDQVAKSESDIKKHINSGDDLKVMEGDIVLIQNEQLSNAIK